MSTKIVGVTVGTPTSPAAMAGRLKPVTSINGQTPDKNGNVEIEVGAGGGGIAVTPQMFGAAGDGEIDDTAAIQAMFDAAGDGGVVFFPAGTYVVRHSDAKTGDDYVAVTIRGRRGLRVILAGGALIKHKAADVGRYTMLRFEDCDGVEISGGIIEGDRQEHQAVSSGYGSKGIHIVNSSNIHIHDMEVRSIWGDCIGATGMAMQCGNVLIENCTLHGSYRNGITIGGVRGGIVRNCHIYDISGGEPQAGIDLEAEYGHDNEETTIEGCHIHDCGAYTIIASSNTHGTVVRDCRLVGKVTCATTSTTGSEFWNTVITEGVSLMRDAVFQGCTLRRICLDGRNEGFDASAIAYDTIITGDGENPTLHACNFTGTATLHLHGCTLNHVEDALHALIYSYNNEAGNVDVTLDGCTVNLWNNSAIHRQLAHGSYRQFRMTDCVITIKSAQMDQSFIRAYAAELSIVGCTIDMSGVDTYPLSEIARFASAVSTLNFHGNTILATIPVKNMIVFDGFAGTAYITQNTAPTFSNVYAGSGGTVFARGNVTANSAEGGADGITPHIGDNGNWYIGTTDTGVKAQGTDGTDGRGIVSFARTSGNGAAGTVDTYTITYTDNTSSTFQVRNGADGEDAPETQVWTFTMADGSVIQMEVAARVVQ